MNQDPWLDPWLPVMHKLAADGEILELGCGHGLDTALLLSRGFRVIATDESISQLVRCAANAPGAALLRHDLREPLPFAEGQFPVIIASLCLHYFPWQQTIDIVDEIHRCIAGGGLLLCRLNSTKDVHFGATDNPVIDWINEGAFYQVRDRQKRFFTNKSVLSLFASGWQMVSLTEPTIDRYTKNKTVWEVILRRLPSPER